MGERRESMFKRGKKTRPFEVSFCECCSVTHFTQTTARERRNIGTKKGSKEASFISGDYAFIFSVAFYHQKAN